MKPYYDCDGITIYHGDCREVLPTLPKCDLLLTDPPYGIDIVDSLIKATKSDTSMFNKSKTGRVSGEWDKQPPSIDTLRICLESCEARIVWGGNYFTNANLSPSRKWLIWDKMNGTNPMADAELAWSDLPGSVRMFRMHHFSKGYDDKVHPTQKPLALMRWCLSFAPDAKTILDPFMGSGTTLVAAKREGRKAVGIELEERYCEAAVKRLQQSVFNFDS